MRSRIFSDASVSVGSACSIARSIAAIHAPISTIAEDSP